VKPLYTSPDGKTWTQVPTCPNIRPQNYTLTSKTVFPAINAVSTLTAKPSLFVNSQVIPSGSNILTYTLTNDDIGTYIVLTTDDTGVSSYTINFVTSNFPVNGTFYIKNTDFTNMNIITITFNGANAVGQYLLTPPNMTSNPPVNSVYCVCKWDGTNLNVF
jgi:hypothetical protein